MSRKRKKQARAPEFVKTLSTPPEDELPGSAPFYHGTRIGLLALPGRGHHAPLSRRRAAERPISPRRVRSPRRTWRRRSASRFPRIPTELARHAGAMPQRDPSGLPVRPDDGGRVEGDLNQFFDRLQDAVEAGGLPAVEGVLREEAIALERMPKSSSTLPSSRASDRRPCRWFGSSSGRYLDSEYEQERH